jgi:glycosyltransferase involved in cell wall biosynthesis
MIHIFLPVHNGERYISQTLNSIIKQQSQNWRLHIILNSCDDNTEKIVSQYEDTDKITIYRSKTKRTIQDNWSEISHICNSLNKNHYITTIGHDDMYKPEFITRMSALIEDHKSAGVFYCHYEFIDECDSFIRNCKPMLLQTDQWKFVEQRLNERVEIFGTGLIWKIQDFIGFNGFAPYPGLLCSDDRAIFDGAKTGPILTSPETLLSYRLHNSSTSRSFTAKKFIKSILAHRLYSKYLLAASTTPEQQELSLRMRDYPKLRLLLWSFRSNKKPLKKSIRHILSVKNISQFSIRILLSNIRHYFLIK